MNITNDGYQIVAKSTRLFIGMAIVMMVNIMAGCGQKGDLYLPKEKSSDSTTAKSATTAVSKTEAN